MKRRQILAGALALGATSALPHIRQASAAEIDTGDLQSMLGDVKPISAGERAVRIERAQALMRANGIAAILVEPGASLIYFMGMEWQRSERFTGAVIPAKGVPVIITPFFEEPSIRETLAITADIRVWQEDEDPVVLIAGALRDRGAAMGSVGIEETVRFFISDGLAQSLPQVRLVSANPVVRGCRMIKSPAEISIMQRANEISMAGVKWAWERAREGMTAKDFMKLMLAAIHKLGGGADGALVLIGENSAYPHGSRAQQTMREGRVVLLDFGCIVHGYCSDSSRTFVLGRAPDDVRRVFDTVSQGQKAVMNTAKIGLPAGKIDDAVRALYETKGYGPDYRLPGLSHRTGHGIGMDGHEPVNLVRGEKTPLTAGMCFSNEPGLYLPGRFGVRLEDCWHMTSDGPVYFTNPPETIDKPFG